MWICGLIALGLAYSAHSNAHTDELTVWRKGSGADINRHREAPRVKGAMSSSQSGLQSRTLRVIS
jgi:hypothetical protein